MQNWFLNIYLVIFFGMFCCKQFYTTVSKDTWMMKILGLPTIAGHEVPRANISMSSLVGIPSHWVSIISSWFVLVFSLPCDLKVIMIKFSIVYILDVCYILTNNGW